MSLARSQDTLGGIHVPRDNGIPRWFNGDLYEIKLSIEQTGGNLGLVVASVPPGGGPPPHVHQQSDEAFFVLDGELDFLDGDRTFSAATGDTVFLPRNTVHRFHNPGIRPAKMLFIYTPGGVEKLFVEAGEEPTPGVPIKPFDPANITAELLELAARLDTRLPA
jgi:mannose-6-phosphate isomerase-like protein (cupin superfamily)